MIVSFVKPYRYQKSSGGEMLYTAGPAEFSDELGAYLCEEGYAVEGNYSQADAQALYAELLASRAAAEAAALAEPQPAHADPEE